ncbi:hypothetical protein EVAR_32937_1 [Eumeta japonica]|uniref:Uncharacterized protein n=1 Tax=Eumeta variegata TaxID=151549 RepID=A0A4C1X2Q4_EUMVA|nr:hypothetical protein EVAR_32937_1 [Eumeta japonica]
MKNQHLTLARCSCGFLRIQSDLHSWWPHGDGSALHPLCALLGISTISRENTGSSHGKSNKTRFNKSTNVNGGPVANIKLFIPNTMEHLHGIWPTVESRPIQPVWERKMNTKEKRNHSSCLSFIVRERNATKQQPVFHNTTPRNVD